VDLLDSLADSSVSLVLGYNISGVSLNATCFSGTVDNTFMLSVRFVRKEGFCCCSVGTHIVKRRSWRFGGDLKVLIPSFISEGNAFEFESELFSDDGVAGNYNKLEFVSYAAGDFFSQPKVGAGGGFKTTSGAGDSGFSKLPISGSGCGFAGPNPNKLVF